jgi:hypothetical protein
MNRVPILYTFVAGTDSTMRLVALLVAGCLAALGVYVLRKGFSTYREFQLLKKTPVEALNRLTSGFVHVRGIANSDQYGISPLTGVACFYFRVRIERAVRVNLKRVWQPVRDHSVRFPFFVDDKTERVVVNPEGAEFEVAQTFCTTVGKVHDKRHHFFDASLQVPEPTEESLHAILLNSLGAAASKVLPSSGSKEKSIWGRQSFRFTEECLLARRECIVLGTYGPALEAGSDPSLKIIRKNESKLPFLITSSTESAIESKLRRRGVSSIVQAVFAFVFVLLILGLALAGRI